MCVFDGSLFCASVLFWNKPIRAWYAEYQPFRAESFLLLDGKHAAMQRFCKGSGKVWLTWPFERSISSTWCFNCCTCARIIENAQYECILKMFEACWPCEINADFSWCKCFILVNFGPWMCVFDGSLFCASALVWNKPIRAWYAEYQPFRAESFLLLDGKHAAMQRFCKGSGKVWLTWPFERSMAPTNISRITWSWELASRSYLPWARRSFW